MLSLVDSGERIYPKLASCPRYDVGEKLSSLLVIVEWPKDVLEYIVS
jgi:hypothetical protein